MTNKTQERLVNILKMMFARMEENRAPGMFVFTIQDPAFPDILYHIKANYSYETTRRVSDGKKFIFNESFFLDEFTAFSNGREIRNSVTEYILYHPRIYKESIPYI